MIIFEFGENKDPIPIPELDWSLIKDNLYGALLSPAQESFVGLRGLHGLCKESNPDLIAYSTSKDCFIYLTQEIWETEYSTFKKMKHDSTKNSVS